MYHRARMRAVKLKSPARDGACTLSRTDVGGLGFPIQNRISGSSR